jgi:sugar (pentulose or hexulose) kinase
LPFIAIDLGSSFLKGAILDARERSLRSLRRLPFPDPIKDLPRGRAEYDPKMIVAEVKRLLSSLMEPAGRYEGLEICSQLSCLILTNSHGEAHSKLIGWRGQRVLQPHHSRDGSYDDVLQQTLTRRGVHKLMPSRYFRA